MPLFAFKIFTDRSTLLFVFSTKVGIFIANTSAFGVDFTKPSTLTEAVRKGMVPRFKIHTLFTGTV